MNNNTKDSVLIKEFKQSDVQRVRNLITKKFGDKTKIQSGYDKDNVSIRKEGDTWEENGKIWILENGIIKNVNKLKSLKKVINIPDFCPECNKFMDHYSDKKSYIFHNHCYDCQILFESELKRLGKYEDYEKSLIKNNVKEYIKKLENDFNSYINEKLDFVSEQGDIENWYSNTNKDQLISEFYEYINSLKSQFEID